MLLPVNHIYIQLTAATHYLQYSPCMPGTDHHTWCCKQLAVAPVGASHPHGTSHAWEASTFQELAEAQTKSAHQPEKDCEAAKDQDTIANHLMLESKVFSVVLRDLDHSAI